MSSIVENVFLPSRLRGEAGSLIKKWMPSYLTEFELLLGLEEGSLKIPENYTDRNNFISIPGEQLPKVVILVPGIIGTPQKSGGAVWRATYRLGVGIAVAETTEDEAIFLAELYGAVIKALIIDHPSINGISSDTRWIDESFDELPTGTELQFLRSASEWFACDVDNVVAKTTGPPEPGTTQVTHTADKVVTRIDKL